MKLSKNKIPVILMAASLFLSLPAISDRIKTENQNRQVEIFLDGRLGSFNGAFVAEEYTFGELDDFAFATRIRPGISHPFENKPPGSTVLVFNRKDFFREAYAVASMKFGPILDSAWEKNNYYILFKGVQWPDIRGVGAGIVSESQSEGKRIYIRPVNDDRVSYESIKRVLSEIPAKGVIFKGGEVLGFPEYIKKVNKILKKEEKIVFNIEFSPQIGIRRVSEGIPVALLHSVPPNLSPNESVRRSLRAMRERSARAFYFRSRSQAEAFREELKGRLINTGTPGGAKIEKKYFNFSFFASISMICGLLILLGAGRKPLLFSVSVLMVFYLLLPSLSRSILVIIIATLTGPVAIKHAVEKSGGFFSSLILIISFSFLGGIVISSIGWAPEFYTKLNLLRGIKFSFILPFFLMAALFFGKGIKEFLKNTVRWSHLVFALFVAVAAGIMVFRTANVSPGFVLQGELALRNLLEDIFVFRPRFKEFLFGHPLLMLALYFYFRDKRFTSVSRFLFVSGVIGLVSMLNSFMHIHTPIAGSVIRSFYGWGIGILTGSFSILVCIIIPKVWPGLKRYF